jgi:hypothetical protein
MQSIDSGNAADDGAPAADAVETPIGLFDEVFQVHAVEGCDEGAGRYCEGEDAEFEIEKHEGVAVCVEDGFHAVVSQYRNGEEVGREGDKYISSVFLMLDTRFSAAWTISSATLW